MERAMHLDLRLTNTPTRTWTKFWMMSYQSMLRKMNLNKTEITDDDGTAVAPLAERRRWHELSVL
jgi:hypothetical protein